MFPDLTFAAIISPIVSAELASNIACIEYWSASGNNFLTSSNVNPPFCTLS